MDNARTTEINERRDFLRVPVCGKVILRTQGEQISIQNAQILDVSANGINLGLEQCLPAGTPVQLSVYIVGDENLFSLDGVVTWCGQISTTSAAKSLANYPLQAGIELCFDRNNRDYADWRALFIA
ncbi:PilZ domain-containing protein [Halothiobacillus sp. DCM-1]|uniref:PilZ domain-containing protein n=1 Tax=Halothiobacillus sp. DCM-1 TaxID=3112558 RepID=UPI00324E1B5D